jgi:hypothetical protein
VFSNFRVFVIAPPFPFLCVSRAPSPLFHYSDLLFTDY